MKKVATVTTEETTYTIEKDRFGVFWVSDENGYCGGTYPTKKKAVHAAETDFLQED